MVNYTCTVLSQEKFWWRLEAILTCKSFVGYNYRVGSIERRAEIKKKEGKKRAEKNEPSIKKKKKEGAAKNKKRRAKEGAKNIYHAQIEPSFFFFEKEGASKI